MSSDSRRSRPGRVERATRAAVRADRTARTGRGEDTPAVDQGTYAALVELAAAIDINFGTSDQYGYARLCAEYRAMARELHLTPEARGPLARDEFADLVAQLRQPTGGVGLPPADVVDR